MGKISNRPGVAGAVLQTHLWLTESLSDPFSSKSLKYHCSQTVKSRYWKYLDNVHHSLFVICHMPVVTCHVICVMCYVSCVTWHMSHVTCDMPLVFMCIQIGGACWLRVCYKRGLPLLVKRVYSYQSDLPIIFGFSCWIEKILKNIFVYQCIFLSVHPCPYKVLASSHRNEQINHCTAQLNALQYM